MVGRPDAGWLTRPGKNNPRFSHRAGLIMETLGEIVAQQVPAMMTPRDRNPLVRGNILAS
jgi:hypothetical protein